jgi:hypothetical protein
VCEKHQDVIRKRRRTKIISSRKEKTNTSLGKQEDHILFFLHYFMETKCLQGVVDDDVKGLP